MLTPVYGSQPVGPASLADVRGMKMMRTAGKTGQGAGRLFGWAASLTVHLLLAGILLSVSVQDGSPGNSAKRIPHSSLAQSNEPLQLEPLIDDLHLEPAQADWQRLEMADQSQLDQPPQPVPDQADALTVAQSEPGALDWQVPAGGGSYRSQFCGAGGLGTRLCFVVDCSGSMVMALDYIRAELKRSIAGLSPGQYFSVIFYATGEPRELAPGRLVRASAGNRDSAISFVDKASLSPVGSTREACEAVVAALEAAFAARNSRGGHVELIYLLTDGEYDGQKVIDAVNQLQRGRPQPAAISVVACGSPDNKGFLQELAEKNRGQFRLVTDKESVRAIDPLQGK